MTETGHPASFRDRAGYVFTSNGLVYRRITPLGEPDYRELMRSGLYDKANESGLLISHEELPKGNLPSEEGVALLPRQLVAISYPYEWCFSQLKAAALAVLELQELSISHNMSLKDATAYNIQFLEGRPLFIDTSSFEIYRDGTVWQAYRQFCQHFLAPLLLMSRVDIRLSGLLLSNIDGIPVDLAATLVPRKTWLNPWLYMHVGLHGKAQRKNKDTEPQEGKMPRNALLGLLKSLRQAVDSLHSPTIKTEWSDYSSASSYDAEAAKHKHELVAGYLDELRPAPSLVWDLGANAGEFSRIFSSRGILTVAWDGDPAAVEHNYREVVSRKETNLLPLVQNFASPSPSIGWKNEERMSFLQRGPADLSVALALIHHLVIGNSVPLSKVVDFFAQTGRHLIIEFVDPDDARVRQLLSTRTDSHEYDLPTFEQAFAQEFEILRKDPIRSSKRILYLMRRKRA